VTHRCPWQITALIDARWKRIFKSFSSVSLEHKLLPENVVRTRTVDMAYVSYKGTSCCQWGVSFLNFNCGFVLCLVGSIARIFKRGTNNIYRGRLTPRKQHHFFPTQLKLLILDNSSYFDFPNLIDHAERLRTFKTTGITSICAVREVYHSFNSSTI
jgi:hypothetical protein